MIPIFSNSLGKEEAKAVKKYLNPNGLVRVIGHLSLKNNLVIDLIQNMHYHSIVLQLYCMVL